MFLLFLLLPRPSYLHSSCHGDLVSGGHFWGLGGYIIPFGALVETGRGHQVGSTPQGGTGYGVQLHSLVHNR
jgi:hypothetical protein